MDHMELGKYIVATARVSTALLRRTAKLVDMVDRPRLFVGAGVDFTALGRRGVTLLAMITSKCEGGGFQVLLIMSQILFCYFTGHGKRGDSIHYKFSLAISLSVLKKEIS